MSTWSLKSGPLRRAASPLRLLYQALELVCVDAGYEGTFCCPLAALTPVMDSHTLENWTSSSHVDVNPPINEMTWKGFLLTSRIPCRDISVSREDSRISPRTAQLGKLEWAA
ncbi:unnamed protein product [Periconia digitata]|uniref:Uncharacterized protein n=1 Tax=Periconia digitata TaxID=1303443 RepID=A0A9W4U150_9PLEO|nr:unnamed protein product [Periconia digitata]